MGYKIVGFQNQPPRPSYWKEEWNETEWDIWTEPTIKITKDDSGWEEAFKNWLEGKPPTDSQEWKKGIVAFCEEINNCKEVEV